MGTPGKSILITALVAMGLLFGLLATLAALNRHDEVASLNQEIQYDDFAFSVREVRKMQSIGPSTAQGIYYVVSLKVANHARRVDYEFKPESPLLVSEDGRQYRISSEGQRALDSTTVRDEPCTYPIPAGSYCVKEIVFDV